MSQSKYETKANFRYFILDYAGNINSIIVVVYLWKQPDRTGNNDYLHPNSAAESMVYIG